VGVVYKAEDIRLGRFFALKVLPEELSRDAQAFERLRREVTAAAVNHPNICTIHDTREQDGHAFIAMELLDGRAPICEPSLGSYATLTKVPEDCLRSLAEVPRPLSFKILKGQSLERRLVKRDFVGKGVMIDGLAQVAAPAQYGVTGLKTLIVGQDGFVYERDFRPAAFDEFRKWRASTLKILDAGHTRMKADSQ